MSKSVLSLLEKASKYYLAELGTFAKLALPVDVNDTPIKIRQQIIPSEFNLAELSGDQLKILDLINITSKPFILNGITGSGKTEIYFHAVAQQLKKDKQVLIMLPEIALSRQIISRFEQAFGFEPAIWNSSVTAVQKKRILRGILTKDVRVVIGTRSALFLPYPNLGLTVIDEEHDSSYKQSEGVLYNARDMAILRSNIEKNQVLLVSATPSIETIQNAKLGKYHIEQLNSRYSSVNLPKVDYIDMRQEDLQRNCWISSAAINSIKAAINNKKQALVFLNRRGYAPLMLCKGCGYRADCNSCSSSMVLHKSKGRMECHYCGNVSKIHSLCPECKEEDSLILCGPGIERIEEELKEKFPDSNIQIMSKEQSSDPKSMQQFLNDMQEGVIDILVGTQVITKGYHFAKLALVVVVDVDACFSGGDLRSSERTFQLLHQVGGRAGRENERGQVLLQTYNPENKVVQALMNNEFHEFIETELTLRQKAFMPPFARAASITITGKNEEKTKNIAKYYLSMAPKSSVRVLGLAEALMYKLSGRYRYKILVISAKNFNLQGYLKVWRNNVKIPSNYILKIDIDPQSFL